MIRIGRTERLLERAAPLRVSITLVTLRWHPPISRSDRTLDQLRVTLPTQLSRLCTASQQLAAPPCSPIRSDKHKNRGVHFEMIFDQSRSPHENVRPKCESRPSIIGWKGLWFLSLFHGVHHAANSQRSTSRFSAKYIRGVQFQSTLPILSMAALSRPDFPSRGLEARPTPVAGLVSPVAGLVSPVVGNTGYLLENKAIVGTQSAARHERPIHG